MFEAASPRSPDTQPPAVIAPGRACSSPVASRATASLQRLSTPQMRARSGPAAFPGATAMLPQALIIDLQATAGNRAVCDLLAARGVAVQRGGGGSKPARRAPDPWREKPWKRILATIAAHDPAEAEAIARYLTTSPPQRYGEILQRVTRELERLGEAAAPPSAARALREAIGQVKPDLPDLATVDPQTLGRALNDEGFFLVFRERIAAGEPRAKGLAYAAFHGGGSCFAIAERLQEMLGRPAQVVNHKAARGGAGTATLIEFTMKSTVSLEEMDHDYVLLTLGGRKVIVDGAWRQFVLHCIGAGDDARRTEFRERLYRDTPRIFVGTYGDLEGLLRDVLGPWTEQMAAEIDAVMRIWQAAV
jgi:hypothetical protein